MRTPSFFLAYCVLVLALFALAKEFGFDAWPFAAATFASETGGGSGGSSSGGGHSSGSSSHK